MAYFTLVLEYIGATYVAQVDAPSAERALAKGVDQMALTGVSGIKNKPRRYLGEQLKVDTLTPVAGLRWVWSHSASLYGRTARLTLVQIQV